jgi:hypothetical protein
VVDQLEDPECICVYGEKWEEYEKIALSKFDADEANREKIRDELHGRAKVDATLNAFDDSDCYS